MAGIVEDLRAVDGTPVNPVSDDDDGFADADELGRVARLELAAQTAHTREEEGDPVRNATASALMFRLNELLARNAAAPARSPRVIAARAAAVPHFLDYFTGFAVPEADAFFPQLAKDILTVGAPFAMLPPADLDAPIVAAWAKYQESQPLIEAAHELENSLFQQAEKQKPERPDGLRVRPKDFPGDSIHFASTPVGDVEYYDERIVRVLRDNPRTRMEIDNEATERFRRKHPES